MARGGIKIPIAVDTSGAQKAINNGLVEPVEDAEEALEKLAKVDAGRDLERDMKRSQDATEKVKDELDDTRAALDKLGYGARKVGDDTKRGMDRAGETTEEFKDEALQNFSEVTSSFTGDMESAVDLVQGTLGGLASGIGGPLGLALGIAAAGVGLITNGLIEAEERAEELRERAREFAAEAVEAGVSTDEWLGSSEQLVTRLQELEQLKSTDWRWFWQEDPTQLQEWTRALEALGRPASEVAEILGSESVDAIRDYRDAWEESRDALEREAEALVERKGAVQAASSAEMRALNEQLDAHNDVIKNLDQEITVRDEAAASADRLGQAGVDAALERAAAEEEAAAAIEAATDAVRDSVLDAYDSMRDAALEYATDEDGALDITRWLEYTQEHAAAVAAYQANLEAIRLTPEQWQNLMEMPDDVRAQWVAQFAALPEEAREPYAAALNDVGSTGGTEATVAFEDAFSPEADVEVTVETKAAASALDSLASARRTATITARTAGVPAARRDLDQLARARHATLQVRADTWRASQAVDSWRRRQEAAPVYINVRARTGGTPIV